MHKHHTRARMLYLFGPGRGPALRDAPGDGGTGGDGGGSGGTDGGQDDGDTGDGGDGKPGSKPKIDGDLDKDRAAATIAAARDGEKKAKQDAKDAKKAVDDLKDSLAVALGLKPDPKSDPAALAAQAAKELTETRAELARVKAEAVLDRVAGKAGGDASALRDSSSFMKQLGDLDPDAADYPDKVTAAVKAAVKANPRLGATATAGPGRQGADITGSGGGSRTRSANLDDAIKKKFGGA